MEQLFTLLSAGGDIGIVVLLGIAWRFDRRLFRLELLVKTMNGNQKK